MHRFILYVALAAALAGCSTPVRLDPAPVEDKSGMGVTAGATAQPPDSAVAGANRVTPVNLASRAQDAAPPSAGPSVVYFDFDSFEIKPEFERVIAAHARTIKLDKNRRVVVEGHTDERGGREYNLALGQRRSEAVRRALGLLGVTEAQLEAVSFGKEKPVATGSDEESWAKNRRAEITYR